MWHRISACLLAFAVPLSVAAQAYPSKLVRIQTVTPGGPYDLAMRGFSSGLSQSIGQPVVIENRAGGNLIPATEACARAPNDGYTFCTADTFAHSINPAVFLKLPYSAKDFTPISVKRSRRPVRFMNTRRVAVGAPMLGISQMIPVRSETKKRCEFPGIVAIHVGVNTEVGQCQKNACVLVGDN